MLCHGVMKGAGGAGRSKRRKLFVNPLTAAFSAAQSGSSFEMLVEKT